MSANLEERLPSVETLSHRSFFVPSYQRGYRWTPDEVRELLEDLRGFAESTSAGGAEEFYCLQPLVVRHMDSGKWEVIDGQQRLTTVYLITRYINEMWRGRDKDAVLSLHYESRERTGEFLEGLRVKDDGTVDFNDENIDFAHISKAYQTIGEWVTSLGRELDKDQFMSAFRRRVRVIWYEPSGFDGVRIFTRINRGKIPLTNAELIRGLFLKSSNFFGANASSDEVEFARLRQMEIGGEWDRIEAALHDDSFWYFLTGPDDPAVTRIDLIFRLLTGIENDDGYALFRAYAGAFPREAEVNAAFGQWEKVKGCFQRLQDWFLDWELYHLIGYLIETGTPQGDLWNESLSIRKSEFRYGLHERIRKSLPDGLLEALQYGHSSVRRVLLLHNVLTTLESRERHFRFPFNRYKSQKWDVEHIHSVVERPPESGQHQREWLSDSARFIQDEKLSKEVEQFVEGAVWAEQDFEELYLKVLRNFSENGEVESINDLSNLALLDRGTNRGYGNAVFPAKRATIIERERDGVFVPIATKNAFLKYYSSAVQEFTFWSESDRQAYFEAIQDSLDSFLNKEKGATA